MFLATIFFVSRIVYYLLRVRFDARGVNWFSQFLDADLLRHHLIQSLFYLHQQPPGYNLFLGIVIKLFPHTYAAVFHAIHLMFGTVITALLFHLMRSLGVGMRLALTATVLFVISPGVVLFENFILYEYQLLFLLTTSAVFLFHFFEHRRGACAVGFLVCQFWLVMVRNYFNLFYFAALFVLLLYCTKHNRRLVIGIGSLLVALVFGLYLKNLVVVGQFTSSTWLGMNMGFITYQLTPEERERLDSQNKLTKVSTVTIGASLSAYRPYITMPARTSIPALDREVKFSDTNSVNYNHPAFLKIGKFYMKDGLFIIRHYPKVYLRAVAVAWFAYFLPPGDFTFFDLNMPHIRGIERAFDVVFFGQCKDAWDRKALRRMKAHGGGVSLLLHTGIFLMIGLPALFIFGTFFLYRGIRRRTLNVPKAVLLGFMLFNVAYITAVSNFLSCFENNRYRFPVDGFYLVLAALALDQIMRRLVRRAYTTGNS
jgi:hypothetical protein